MIPEPRIIIQNWCMYTPSAENNMPPPQHSADSTPTLRGPTCSSQPPQMAADSPKKTKNSVYIQPRVEICQSQLVVKSCAQKPTSGPHLMASLMPSALESGNQNTEKP